MKIILNINHYMYQILTNKIKTTIFLCIFTKHYQTKKLTLKEKQKQQISNILDYKLTKASYNLGNLGVPKPVTGSQNSFAIKPTYSSAEHPILYPMVTSFA